MSEACDRLVDWYQTLTPATLDRIGELYAQDATFEDPFNRVRGVDRIAAIFRDMFESVESPTFAVRDVVASGASAFLTWDFRFRARGRAMEVHGVSRVEFGDDGRVVSHRDYWDAAGELYAKLPVVGPLMRFLRRRLAAR